MNQDTMKAVHAQAEAASAFARWMIDAGEAFARLQLESLRASLDESDRSLRAALEAPSADRLMRMRGEMLVAESRRMLEFAQRHTELVLRQRGELFALLSKLGAELGALARPDSLPEPFRRMLEAARSVEQGMAALAQQSTGMWEAHLRTSKEAIEQALAGTGRGTPPKA